MTNNRRISDKPVRLMHKILERFFSVDFHKTSDQTAIETSPITGSVCKNFWEALHYRTFHFADKSFHYEEKSLKASINALNACNNR